MEGQALPWPGLQLQNHPLAWLPGLSRGSAGVDLSMNQPCLSTDLRHEFMDSRGGSFLGPSLAQHVRPLQEWVEGVKVRPQSPTAHMHVYIHRHTCDPSHLRHPGTCTLPPCPCPRCPSDHRSSAGDKRRFPSMPLTPSAPRPPRRHAPKLRTGTHVWRSPPPTSRACFRLLEPEREGGEQPPRSGPHLPFHFQFSHPSLLI